MTINCTCGKRFTVTEKHAGKTLTCPECGDPVAVPDSHASRSLSIEPRPVPPPGEIPDGLLARLDTLIEINDRCRDHLSRIQARVSLALIVAGLVFLLGGVVVIYH